MRNRPLNNGWPNCTEPECVNKSCRALNSDKCFVHTRGWGWVKRLKIRMKYLFG